MNSRDIIKLFCILVLFCSCSATNDSTDFLGSGSIVISKLIPNSNVMASSEGIASTQIKSDFDPGSMNQLLGYFPPSEDFTPAFNEMWLEVDTKEHTASLMQGSLPAIVLPLKDAITANPGQYFISAKELNPTWLAPESYFHKRGLNVPDKNSRLRTGAYGEMAIFTTSDLVIHSAPFWTPEVGGLRMSGKKLSKVFSSLPLGSPIVVK